MKLYIFLFIFIFVSNSFACTLDSDCNPSNGGSCVNTKCVCNVTMGYVGTNCEKLAQTIQLNTQITVTAPKNDTFYVYFKTDTSQWIRLLYTVCKLDRIFY